MSAGRIILYILAAGFLVFAFLLILGSFDQGQLNTPWLLLGFAFIGIGFGLIYFAGRIRKSEQVEQNVTLNIDLPENVEMDQFKCESCGGVLSTDNVEMVAGAPWVNCPYCGTSYQLKEDPRW